MLNVSGRILTKVLQESLSFRQIDMRDEWFNANDIKEGLCYTSLNYLNELKGAKCVSSHDETIRPPFCEILTHF